MFLHYKSALRASKTVRTMAIDFGPISSYSVNQLNNFGRVPQGDRGLNWHASRWNSGTVPPAV